MTVAEKVTHWQAIIAEMRGMLIDAGADSVAVTWGKVTVHVTLEDAARAVTPAGLLDLSTPEGLKRLAERTEVIP